MLQVRNGKNKSWQIALGQDQILVDNLPFEWDLVQTAPNTFHILKDHQSYVAELVEADFQAKRLVLKVNGNRHEIHIKDRFDLLLDRLGLNQAHTNKVNNLKAPMPGLILEIKVSAGQEVKQGDQILILEAMKMENILKAPADGVIASVKVGARDNVEKNQVLVEFK